MQLRWPLAARWSSVLALLASLSWLVATTPTAGWPWTVVLVAVVGVLAVAALRRPSATRPPAVLLRLRGRDHDEPARQSAPGRPGRPQPRAPGARRRAPTSLTAGRSTG